MSGFNPLVALGSLNRLRASVLFPALPGLTVISSNLGREGIQLDFGGASTTQIDVMTGIVTSPEPYLTVALTVHLLKTQFLAQTWRAQMELLSLLGDGVVRPDSATMTPYFFQNTSILGIGAQAFNGTSADYPVRIGGTYQVNAALFNS
jgi:hypothetical protein